MSAGITRLRTQAERRRAEQADHLRDVLRSYPGLPEQAVTQIVAALDGQTVSSTSSTHSVWRFVMVDPGANAAVVDWLAQHSSRPIAAMRLWAKLFGHLRWDTGEVAMTREDLADAVGIPPREVSRIMTELESIKAVSRRREKVPGLKGAGPVRYYVSPLAGTHLVGDERDAAQSEAPPLLTLMEGGKA